MTAALSGSLLFIEDDPLDAEIVIRCMQSIPGNTMEVEWVKSLAEANNFLAAVTPQIVLTDLTLPDATGLDVLTALLGRNDSDEFPIIVQTGITDEATPIRALELGVQDYLPKGTITADVLARSIRHSVVRRRAQSELSDAQDDRARSEHDLDSFAHVVAHDLRAPVRTARLFADRLLHRLETDDAEILDFGARLDSSLAQVDRMILSMLDYAAVESVPTDLEPVELRQVLDESIGLVHADLDSVGGSIDVRIPAETVVLGNHEQLKRVFVNLLTNSIKFRRAEVPLEIRINCEAHVSRLIIELADNGTGVEPDDGERAFGLLERLHPSHAAGLGFGLPMSRRIVESIGGSIRFKPLTPPGATIELVLTQLDGGL